MLAVIRVLLVDDQEGDLLLVRSLLRHDHGHDYLIDWASSLDQAVSAYRERGDHDVYLLDYQLDGHSGMDVMRALKAAGSGAPCIIISHWLETPMDLQHPGVSDVLGKGDLTAPLLARAIHLAISHQQLRHQCTHAQRRHRQLQESVMRLWWTSVTCLHQGSSAILAEGATHRTADAFPDFSAGSAIAWPGPGLDATAEALIASLDEYGSPGERLEELVRLLHLALAGDQMILAWTTRDLSGMVAMPDRERLLMALVLCSRMALGSTGLTRTLSLGCTYEGVKRMITVRAPGPLAIAKEDLCRDFFEAPGQNTVRPGCVLAQLVLDAGGSVLIGEEDGGLVLGARFAGLDADHDEDAAERQPAPRLMLIENDPTLRELWTQDLGHQGFDVVAVQDTTMEPDVLAATLVDMIIVDVQYILANSSMFSTFRDHPQGPLVIGTVDRMPTPLMQPLVDGILVKPFGLSMLRSTLLSLLTASSRSALA